MPTSTPRRPGTSSPAPPTVVVASIDTGVDYTHEDLAANMWVNPGEIPGDGIDNDGNGYVDDVYGIDAANGDSDPMDDNGHGTHTSGTIGAVGNNGIGRGGRELGRPDHGPEVPSATAAPGRTSDAIECHRVHDDDEDRLRRQRGGQQQQLGRRRLLEGARGRHPGQQRGGDPVRGGGGQRRAWTTTRARTTRPATTWTGSSPWRPPTTTTSGRRSPTTGRRRSTSAAPGVDILSTVPGDGYETYERHLDGRAARGRRGGHAGGLQSGGATLAEVKAAIMDGVDPVASLAGITVSGGRLNLADVAVPDRRPGRLLPDRGPRRRRAGDRHQHARRRAV